MACSIHEQIQSHVSGLYTNRWQNFCHGVKGEEEKVEDGSDLDLDYKFDFYHEDDWDPEELVIDLEEEEENNDNDNNMAEDDDGYTASELAYMNVINALEDNNSVEGAEEEEEEKDER